MIDDEKLAIDESNRVAQHEAIKSEARQEAQAEIARHAHQKDEQYEQETAVIGEHFKEKALKEVTRTDVEIERARNVARVSQVVDYVFYVIYGLIGLEVFLDLLGAREASPFKQLIDSLTSPLLTPFHRLMPDMARGRFELRVSYLVALLVYVMLHLAINGLLRLLAHRKTAI